MEIGIMKSEIRKVVKPFDSDAAVRLLQQCSPDQIVPLSISIIKAQRRHYDTRCYEARDATLLTSGTYPPTKNNTTACNPPTVAVADTATSPDETPFSLPTMEETKAMYDVTSEVGDVTDVDTQSEEFEPESPPPKGMGETAAFANLMKTNGEKLLADLVKSVKGDSGMSFEVCDLQAVIATASLLQENKLSDRVLKHLAIGLRGSSLIKMAGEEFCTHSLKNPTSEQALNFVTEKMTELNLPDEGDGLEPIKRILFSLFIRIEQYKIKYHK